MVHCVETHATGNGLGRSGTGATARGGQGSAAWLCVRGPMGARWECLDVWGSPVLRCDWRAGRGTGKTGVSRSTGALPGQPGLASPVVAGGRRAEPCELRRADRRADQAFGKIKRRADEITGLCRRAAEPLVRGEQLRQGGGPQRVKSSVRGAPPAVLCVAIGEPIKQSAELSGEPITGGVKTSTSQSTGRLLSKAAAACPEVCRSCCEPQGLPWLGAQGVDVQALNLQRDPPERPA